MSSNDTLQTYSVNDQIDITEYPNSAHTVEVRQPKHSTQTRSSVRLQDSLGRHFPYIRLSLTDVCNFRCQYCLPDGYQCDSPQNFLSVAEIKRLVNGLAQLGVSKIRLTGGEPTVRKDFNDIVKVIASTPGINTVALTTNGYKLKERVLGWVNRGLTSLNVSVDSLDPRLFHDLTGHNRLISILDGIEFAKSLPLKSIKLNAVLLKDINSHQFDQFVSMVKDSPISIRFIELMQTGDNEEYFKQYHVGADLLQQQLLERGWTQRVREKEAGPAKEFIHSDYQGSIGLIAPYSKDFCKTCNRLRITATGDLRLCLFGEQGGSLRHLLQNDAQQEDLMIEIQKLLQHKVAHHFLHDGNTGITPHLASVGG